MFCVGKEKALWPCMAYKLECVLKYLIGSLKGMLFKKISMLKLYSRFKKVDL